MATQRARRQVDRERRRIARSRPVAVEGEVGRAPAQGQGERHHHDGADRGNNQVGHAPAMIGKGELHRDRPDGAGEIVAAGGGRHGEPAPPDEPLRYVGDQRTEGGRAAEADDGLQQRERPYARHGGGEREADGEAERRQHKRRHDAHAVDEPPDGEVAEREAGHGHRVGQRCVAACHAELGLHLRQHHDHRPQPDAADRGERDRGAEPRPGISAVDVVAGVRCAHRASGPLGSERRRTLRPRCRKAGTGLRATSWSNSLILPRVCGREAIPLRCYTL
jgi:hypothetical protein